MVVCCWVWLWLLVVLFGWSCSLSVFVLGLLLVSPFLSSSPRFSPFSFLPPSVLFFSRFSSSSPVALLVLFRLVCFCVVSVVCGGGVLCGVVGAALLSSLLLACCSAAVRLVLSTAFRHFRGLHAHHDPVSSWIDWSLPRYVTVIGLSFDLAAACALTISWC